MTIDEAVDVFEHTENYSYFDFYEAERVAIECMERCKRIDGMRPISTRGYCEYAPDCTCDHYANGYNECLFCAKGEEND